MAIKRKMIQVSDELEQWYVVKAKAMGISQSALMVTALSQYKDHQEMMIKFGKVDDMLRQLEALKSKIDDE